MDYSEYFDELITLSKLLGVQVYAKQTDDFDLTTLGLFDPSERHILIFFEKEIKKDATTLFTLAHEFRHAYQWLTNMYADYWTFSIGIGSKPSVELRNEVEDDADRWASAFLKGRGIRIPKKLFTENEV